MMYLLQIYKMVEDKKLFIQIFSDLDYELNEMGWSEDPEGLVNDLLSNHFGFSVDDEKQLSMLTSAILKKQNDLSFLERICG